MRGAASLAVAILSLAASAAAAGPVVTFVEPADYTVGAPTLHFHVSATTTAGRARSQRIDHGAVNTSTLHAASDFVVWSPRNSTALYRLDVTTGVEDVVTTAFDAGNDAVAADGTVAYTVGA